MPDDDFSKLIQNLKNNNQKYSHEFTNKGVLVIENFLSPSQLKRAQKECLELEDLAYFNKLTGNAYLTKINPAWPKDDPRAMTEQTSLGVIAYDQIPKNNLLSKLYSNNYILQEIAKIVGENNLYRYSCKLGALNISVMKDKDYLRWHFDQSDFVVSVPIQDSLRGGKFQMVKNLRSPKNNNFTLVKKALLGLHPDTEELQAPEGSLIIFRGKNTLHRVTPICGVRSRLVALLGYATQPGVCSSDHLLQIRYGRTS